MKWNASKLYFELQQRLVSFDIEKKKCKKSKLQLLLWEDFVAIIIVFLY